jgi:hypothetical protein
MSLFAIIDEIDRRWPGDLPSMAHMWALDVTIELKPGQLYIDMGEVHDIFAFYNTFADELNTLAGEKVRDRYGVLIDDKPGDTSKLFGGMQFMVQLVKNGLAMDLCVTVYKSNAEFPVSRVLAQGRNEIQALLDLGRPDVVRGVLKSGHTDRDVLDCLGGIYAARQFGFTDADVLGWFKRGHIEPDEEEAMTLAGIDVHGDGRRGYLRRIVPDHLFSLIRRKR